MHDLHVLLSFFFELKYYSKSNFLSELKSSPVDKRDLKIGYLQDALYVLTSSYVIVQHSEQDTADMTKVLSRACI